MYEERQSALHRYKCEQLPNHDDSVNKVCEH